MTTAILAHLLTVCLAVSATAHEATGCTGFAWPVDRELEWMTAAGVATPAGARLAGVPAGALDLSLSTEVKLPFTPSGRPDPLPRDPHAGFIMISKIPQPGLYQVSVSGPAWVDVFQDRAALAEESETVSTTCPILHKSMRFRLSAAPATIQVSDSPDSHVKLTIRRAPDR